MEVTLVWSRIGKEGWCEDQCEGEECGGHTGRERGGMERKLHGLICMLLLVYAQKATKRNLLLLTVADYMIPTSANQTEWLVYKLRKYHVFSPLEMIKKHFLFLLCPTVLYVCTSLYFQRYSLRLFCPILLKFPSRSQPSNNTSSPVPHPHSGTTTMTRQVSLRKSHNFNSRGLTLSHSFSHNPARLPLTCSCAMES